MTGFADLPLVDCHVHMRGLNSIPNLLEVLDACGLDALCVQALSARSDSNLALNPVQILFKALHPDRIYSFGGLRHALSGDVVDPLPYDEQARRLVAMGCDGIKMIEGKPTARKALGEPLDDPGYDPFYSFLEESGTPLLFHVADPETFWDPELCSQSARDHGWYYGDGTFTPKEELYAELERALAKHPGLRVVFAHFLFLSADLERAAAFLDRWPNANLDLTPGGEMYVNFSVDAEASREFFTRYADRIFFGTDNAGGSTVKPGATAWPVSKVAAMRRFLETRDEFEFFGATIRGLGLDRDALAAIHAGNWRRFTGPEPKPVDVRAAAEECGRLTALAEAVAGTDEIVAELRETKRRLVETSS